MNDITLPPLPGHPRHHEMDWTPEERATIAKFARAAIAADRAKGGEAVAIVDIAVPHLRSLVVKSIPGASLPAVGDFLYPRPSPAPETREGAESAVLRLDWTARTLQGIADRGRAQLGDAYPEVLQVLGAVKASIEVLSTSPAPTQATQDAEQAAMYRQLRDGSAVVRTKVYEAVKSVWSLQQRSPQELDDAIRATLKEPS